MGETDGFEWDDAKDAANQKKHGVALIVAAAIFKDDGRLEMPSRWSSAAEARHVVIGEAFGLIWACVYTVRGRRRRLISLRRAHRKERRAYETRY